MHLQAEYRAILGRVCLFRASAGLVILFGFAPRAPPTSTPRRSARTSMCSRRCPVESFSWVRCSTAAAAERDRAAAAPTSSSCAGLRTPTSWGLLFRLFFAILHSASPCGNRPGRTGRTSDAARRLHRRGMVFPCGVPGLRPQGPDLADRHTQALPGGTPRHAPARHRAATALPRLPSAPRTPRSRAEGHEASLRRGADLTPSALSASQQQARPVYWQDHCRRLKSAV